MSRNNIQVNVTLPLRPSRSIWRAWEKAIVKVEDRRERGPGVRVFFLRVDKEEKEEEEEEEEEEEGREEEEEREGDLSTYIERLGIGLGLGLKHKIRIQTK
jgi:hypothetical protein